MYFSPIITADMNKLIQHFYFFYVLGAKLVFLGEFYTLFTQNGHYLLFETLF